MKILVVGGSNSVMKPGYLDHVNASLKQNGIKAPTFRNLSVGTNNCLIGLENIRLFDGLEQYDKIIIEFAVNDLSLIAADAFETWQCAYEGLIRHVLRQAPRIQVYNLILGRRPERTRALTERIRTGLHEIVGHYQDRYDIRIVDFDKHLRDSLQNEQKRIEQHYRDGVHYDLEIGAPLLGRYLAQHLLAGPLPATSSWPASLCAASFDRAEFCVLPEASTDFETHEFKNARFCKKAVEMRAGESLTVDLPGPLICLSFLATVASRPLLVEEEGENPILLYTSHAGLEKTPEKFIIKNFAFEWKKWSSLERRGRRKVTFSAVERADVGGFQPYLVNRYNMVPGWDEGRGPNLSNLLYLPLQ